MPKVSVIIPVYNVEVYFKQCIESIINQTFKDIEIILINDGSSDNSLILCRQYANIDSRILIIDKQNGGVSSARNEGIKKAKGDYITFVDADDWLELNFIEEMYSAAQVMKVDLVLCGRINELYSDYQINTTCGIPDGTYRGNRFLREFICPINYRISSTPHCKLYKADFIKNKICFKEDLSHDEDYVFIIEFLTASKNVASIGSKYLYHYRSNPNSITHNYRKNMWENKIRVFNYVENILDSTGNSDLINLLNGKTIINAIKTLNNEFSHKGYQISLSYIRAITFDQTLKNAFRNFKIGNLPKREYLFSILLKSNCIFLCYLFMKLGVKSKNIKLKIARVLN